MKIFQNQIKNQLGFTISLWDDCENNLNLPIHVLQLENQLKTIIKNLVKIFPNTIKLQFGTVFYN